LVYVKTTQPFPHARRIPNDFNDPSNSFSQIRRLPRQNRKSHRS
jgi:hypothetical protein